ncbi:MAG: hypothetical protein V4538_00225 [Bacteroidota bacterium]
MSFNGNEGAPISIQDAAQLTKNFRATFPNQPIANFVGEEWIKQLLSQEGAKGLRIYNGLDAEGNIKPIIVAANSVENDMLELAINYTVPCPSRCSSANPLNS